MGDCPRRALPPAAGCHQRAADAGVHIRPGAHPAAPRRGLGRDPRGRCGPSRAPHAPGGTRPHRRGLSRGTTHRVPAGLELMPAGGRRRREGGGGPTVRAEPRTGCPCPCHSAEDVALVGETRASAASLSCGGMGSRDRGHPAAQPAPRSGPSASPHTCLCQTQPSRNFSSPGHRPPRKSRSAVTPPPGTPTSPIRPGTSCHSLRRCQAPCRPECPGYSSPLRSQFPNSKTPILLIMSPAQRPPSRSRSPAAHSPSFRLRPPSYYPITAPPGRASPSSRSPLRSGPPVPTAPLNLLEPRDGDRDGTHKVPRTPHGRSVPAGARLCPAPPGPARRGPAGPTSAPSAAAAAAPTVRGSSAPSGCRWGHAPVPASRALIGVLGGAGRGAGRVGGPNSQWEAKHRARTPPMARPLHVRVCDDSGEGAGPGGAAPHWLTTAVGAGPVHGRGGTASRRPCGLRGSPGPVAGACPTGGTCGTHGHGPTDGTYPTHEHGLSHPRARHVPPSGTAPRARPHGQDVSHPRSRRVPRHEQPSDP